MEDAAAAAAEEEEEEEEEEDDDDDEEDAAGAEKEWRRSKLPPPGRPAAGKMRRRMTTRHSRSTLKLRKQRHSTCVAFTDCERSIFPRAEPGPSPTVLLPALLCCCASDGGQPSTGQPLTRSSTRSTNSSTPPLGRSMRSRESRR